MLFESNRQNNCIILSSEYTQIIDLHLIGQVFEEIKKMDVLVLKGCDWIVVSLPATSGVETNASQILCRIALFLSKLNCRLAVITNELNCARIKSNNINSMVYVYASLDKFYNAQHINDVENIKLFVETLTYSIFETMKVLTNITVRVEKIESVRGEVLSIPEIQFGANAALICSHFSGSVMVGFKANAYKEIMSRFVQMPVDTITDELRDGSSELLNVIIGQAKMALNEKKFNINQVIPTSFAGEKIVLTTPPNQLSTLIRYQSEVGEFVLLFSANSQQKLSLAS